MQQYQSSENYVTIKDAAAELHVAESTVWRWVDRGLIPAYRLPGRRIRLKKEDVARALKPIEAEAHKAPPNWREWIVGAQGKDVPPEVAIAKADAVVRRMRAERAGREEPDSTEDIRRMREERSAEMDSW